MAASLRAVSPALAVVRLAAGELRVARRHHAGRAAERVDAQARIVGDRRAGRSPARRGAPWRARSRRRSRCGSAASSTTPSEACETSSAVQRREQRRQLGELFGLCEASTNFRGMGSTFASEGAAAQAEGRALRLDQLADAWSARASSRSASARENGAPSAVPCSSTKPPDAGHDDVHVGVAGGVLDVLEVEQRRALDDADRDGGDEVADRRALDRAAREQPGDGVVRGDEGAGDGGGARAAVGLQHVAVERDGALAERGEVEHRAQRAADQALDLLRAAALLAARRLAVAARVGGARQHAVLGGDPALAAAAVVRRHALLDRGGAQHPGVGRRRPAPSPRRARCSGGRGCTGRSASAARPPDL